MAFNRRGADNQRARAGPSGGRVKTASISAIVVVSSAPNSRALAFSVTCATVRAPGSAMTFEPLAMIQHNAPCTRLRPPDPK